VLLIVAALSVVPFTTLAPRAADADTGESAAALRAQADAIAGHYFAALSEYETLGRQIADNRRLVATLEVRARRARHDARERAVLAYKEAGVQLATLIDSNDALTAARRAELIDQVNARDNAVFTRLRIATRDLQTTRRALEADRQRQAGALADLQSQSRDMEAKLALAQQQEQAAAEQVAQLVAGTTTTTTSPTPPPTIGSADAAAAAPTTAPTTTSPPAAPPAPSAPPYEGTSGVNPHHDDPFLTCVRNRESGGNYSVVNPAGPYLGAYQFLEATWNATANHAGRQDLVGVPANLASPYDQDEMAWDLYQWQGMGPWGGGCP